MKAFRTALVATFAAAGMSGQALAATGIQIGASGKSYASTSVQCALHPVEGISPMVQVGLYNPKRNASAEISLNGSAVASVTFFSPDSQVWLVNGMNSINVALSRRSTDRYSFDATATEENYCLPDTTNNVEIGDLEYAASNNLYATTYATISTSCALNPATGRAQPFVNLFDNSNLLFNVSLNLAALTQLSSTRTHTPIFLAPGWNVISASNGALSIIDYYVRHGGDGTCTLP